VKPFDGWAQPESRDRTFQARLKVPIRRNREILDRLPATQGLAWQHLDLAI
jgi:hypothetical protein